MNPCLRVLRRPVPIGDCSRTRNRAGWRPRSPPSASRGSSRSRSRVADRWREAELRDALEAARIPLADLVSRGMGYFHGGEDVRAFRRACADGRVVPAPSLLLRSAMSEARTMSDPAGNAKLAKASQGGAACGPETPPRRRSSRWPRAPGGFSSGPSGVGRCGPRSRVSVPRPEDRNDIDQRRHEMGSQEREQRRHERREREIDRIEAQIMQRSAAWLPDVDGSRLPPGRESEFTEEIRPVVIVGLPGPWYLAKRIIGVYLVLLAITVVVAIVFALAIASCGILAG